VRGDRDAGRKRPASSSSSRTAEPSHGRAAASRKAAPRLGALASDKANLPTSWLPRDQPAPLRYVSGEEPGLRRVRQGAGFRYVDPQGRNVRDPETLVRIRSLAIPPAYRDVWICATEDGHLQATGRDARGRKQYRYHPQWRAVRDANKFDRMLQFGHALPRVRERAAHDLALKGLVRERVLASVVQLLEQTLVRVGNGEYARDNESFGLTTLRDDHVEVEPQKIRFVFRGKSGVPHDVTVEDRRLVRVIRHCLDIPGQELFRWLDADGSSRDVGSADVNAYIREISGGDFTAKDFRTWAASVLALEALAQRPYTSATQAKREVVAAVKEVASRLSNTPAVCRKCYIHPVVMDTYLQSGPQGLPSEADATRTPGLNAGECRLLTLLERNAAATTALPAKGNARRKTARRVGTSRGAPAVRP
jgi:DNA topoisomerase-1